jgi:hypothetical protein
MVAAGGQEGARRPYVWRLRGKRQLQLQAGKWAQR